MPGTLRVWAEPFTPLRVPKIFDLRPTRTNGPTMTSNTYYDWFLRACLYHLWRASASCEVGGDVQGFPPIQKPNTFTVDDALKMMHETIGGVH